MTQTPEKGELKERAIYAFSFAVVGTLFLPFFLIVLLLCLLFYSAFLLIGPFLILTRNYELVRDGESIRLKSRRNA